MKIINPSFEILTQTPAAEILAMVERAGRTCYKSEDKITPESAAAFVRMLIKNGHEAMIEHFNITVGIICDRGVTHEVVRHRIASYGQESTRYCNYAQEKFGNEITVIEPFFFINSPAKFNVWLRAMANAEAAYMELLDLGATPQEARSVLPNSLKTEIIVTMNLREWRHFFRLRAAKTAHPQMQEVACPLLARFKAWLPPVYEDIHPEQAAE